MRLSLHHTLHVAQAGAEFVGGQAPCTAWPCRVVFMLQGCALAKVFVRGRKLRSTPLSPLQTLGCKRVRKA